MTINLDFFLKGLDGEAVRDEKGNQVHAGRMVANYLSSLTKGNSLKLWDWSTTLYKVKVLQIDKTDVEVLKGLIETAEYMSVLAKAQVLMSINEQTKTNEV